MHATGRFLEVTTRRRPPTRVGSQARSQSTSQRRAILLSRMTTENEPRTAQRILNLARAFINPQRSSFLRMARCSSEIVVDLKSYRCRAFLTEVVADW